LKEKTAFSLHNNRLRLISAMSEFEVFGKKIAKQEEVSNSKTQDMGLHSVEMCKKDTIYCAFVTISSLKSRLLDTMPIVFDDFASL
jgi:hypothetical protein